MTKTAPRGKAAPASRPIRGGKNSTATKNETARTKPLHPGNSLIARGFMGLRPIARVLAQYLTGKRLVVLVVVLLVVLLAIRILFGNEVEVRANPFTMIIR
ncbi:MULTISPECIES: hypothetical protein [Sorangium]|uniref:hypothetical protein n=1 Tax=Sorangium TaxID=39643 RepID=UPI003D9C3824